jgi:hypothetical protein
MKDARVPPCGVCGFPHELMGTKAHQELHDMLRRAQRQAHRARSWEDREGWRFLASRAMGRPPE